MLFEPEIHEVAAIARELLGLRQLRRRARLVGIAEEELASLHRRRRTGRGDIDGSIDHRMCESIEIAEVLARLAERSQRLEIERREHAHSSDLGEVAGVFTLAALALLDITCEEDDDGVEVRRRQS